MTTPPTIAIVGASLAGAKAAEAARAAGFQGRIVLIGEELAPPYERPPLSKGILRGEAGDDSSRVHDEGYYRDHAIEVLADTATALDVDARTITVGRGATIGFDAAVLATGAAVRPLSIPGADLAGVHYLRSLDDAIALRASLQSGRRVAVVGAGWIGSEVAASARQLGRDVVLIDPAPVPLHRVLGEEIGAVFARLHADNGVELRLGAGVRELRGDGGRVTGVVLHDGRVEEADVVVVGVGVVPRVELATAAGLAVDDGVVVGADLATSAAGVFACGDVARAHHPFYERHVRIEHWANALNQGGTAGRNAAAFVAGAGAELETYDRLPYFFSDQYDLGMEYVGFARGDDPAVAVAVRGDLDARKFIAFWHRDGVVEAAMNVNIWDVVDDLKAIVSSRKAIDVARLTDDAVDLGDLA